MGETQALEPTTGGKMTVFVRENHNVGDLEYGDYLAHKLCVQVGDVLVMREYERMGYDTDPDDVVEFTTYYYRNSQGIQCSRDWEEECYSCRGVWLWEEETYIAGVYLWGPYTLPRLHDHAYRTNCSTTSYNMRDSRECGWQVRAWAKRQGRRSERRVGKQLTQAEW